MDDRSTPGQRAYAAYVTAVERQPVAVPITTAMWVRLLPAEQRAWEAAAQAVLAQCTPQEEPPRRWRPQPLTLDLDPAVRREDAPSLC